jgi:hypothetical protein
MYFLHSFILVILPFFTAAVPPPTSGGISISIAKRGSPSVVGPSLYAGRVQTSIAYAIRDFPRCSAPVT